MKTIFAVAALALSLPLVACSGDAPEADPVEVSNAYIAPPMKGRDVAAGYFTLQSTGAADALLSASSPIAERVEVHTHTMTDGVMSMRKIDRVEIPAGGTVAFERGGYHLMLFGVSLDETTTETPLTLTYESGADVTLIVPIGQP